MMLSQKSVNFAKKILKHNLLPTSHTHNHSQNVHDHSTCSHTTSHQPKPYLHLHDHRKQREIYQKPTQQKLQCMRAFKQQGNDHFKNQRYREATHYYNKMIVYADYTFPEKERDKQEMEGLVQTGYCNLGMSLVKIGDMKEARGKFFQGAKGPNDKVIIKSLYWMIKCDIGLGQFDKANLNLRKIQEFGQKTKNQVSELEIQLKKATEGYEKKSKAVFGQMFGKQGN